MATYEVLAAAEDSGWWGPMPEEGVGMSGELGTGWNYRTRAVLSSAPETRDFRKSMCAALGIRVVLSSISAGRDRRTVPAQCPGPCGRYIKARSAFTAIPYGVGNGDPGGNPRGRAEGSVTERDAGYLVR